MPISDLSITRAYRPSCRSARRTSRPRALARAEEAETETRQRRRDERIQIAGWRRRQADEGILAYTRAPIVDSSCSAIFDSALTTVIEGAVVKVLAWYGNEGATQAGWWTSPHAFSAHSQSIGPERYAAERGATFVIVGCCARGRDLPATSS
jgi:hypothetical protein